MSLNMIKDTRILGWTPCISRILAPILILLISLSKLLRSHIVNDFVIVRSIIDLVVVGSLVHLWVPWVVYRPGAWGPLSHLIVILDWWSWASWLSDPVEDLVIVLRVVNTLWPWSSPGVSIHVDWNALRLGLEVHNVIDLLLVGDRSAHASKSNGSEEFHDLL